MWLEGNKIVVWWQIFLLVAIPYNVAGMLTVMLIDLRFGCDGFEFVNPNWIYRNYRVNKFGAIFLSILLNLLCPIWTVIYWFYKLCTVGRE
jgi:hypothetical protein